jgi:hypothetical protein
VLHNSCFVLPRGIVSSSPNPQAGGPPLVGCPRLLIPFIRSYPPHQRTFLHLQLEDAPCRGDRDPLTWVKIPQSVFIVGTVECRLIGKRRLILTRRFTHLRKMPISVAFLQKFPAIYGSRKVITTTTRDFCNESDGSSLHPHILKFKFQIFMLSLPLCVF